MKETKAWWTSKTIWTNLVALIGAIVVSAGFDAAQWGEMATVALAVVNVALRTVTSEGVTLGSNPPS
jgi:hypothetical protein